MWILWACLYCAVNTFTREIGRVNSVGIWGTYKWKKILTHVNVWMFVCKTTQTKFKKGLSANNILFLCSVTRNN